MPQSISDTIDLLETVQHVVIDDASWELYESLLDEIGDRPIRITYDQGRMELMSPLREHEEVKKLVGRMIEQLTLMTGMSIKSLGSTTFRRKDKAKGLEPDECYYFRDEKKMRGRRRLDLKRDPPPELVVEIDITHRSIAREPIYAALGVPEIWRFDGARLHCVHLVDGAYSDCKMSLAFPFLEPALLTRFIEMLNEHEETSIIRAFMNWVQSSGWIE